VHADRTRWNRPAATLLLFVAATIALVTPAGSRADGPALADPDAMVTAVEADGRPGAYTFSVTIRSNDTGPQHYADWWEVVDERGGLVYRRVLLHDHADEQPFSRTGGPVAVASDQNVIVRAHVHPTGYSGQAMRGSVKAGFKPVSLPAGFATDLEVKQPLPERP
jgi:hypothetical protein